MFMEAPPALEEDWRALVDHYAALHALTPEKVALDLPAAVLTMRSAADGNRRLDELLARLPPAAWPATLRDLIARLERIRFPDWPASRSVFCRCDPNTRNFIRRPGQWASVDWENSGWGDPAYELADLLTHPAYGAVLPARRDWLIEAYCAARADPGLAPRIRVYRLLCLVWWVARFACYLYEWPRGLDRRLAARPANWRAETQAKYDRYLGLATAALREPLV